MHCGTPLALVGFVRGRWCHWGAPWESLGAFGLARFIAVRPEDRRVRSRSLENALRVVAFVRCRWGTPWMSSDLFGVSGFIGLRPWGRRVRSG